MLQINEIECPSINLLAAAIRPSYLNSHPEMTMDALINELTINMFNKTEQVT